MPNATAPKDSRLDGQAAQPVSTNRKRQIAKGNAPRISPIVIVGMGTLYAAVGLTWFIGEDAPLREFAFLILVAVGAATSLAELAIRAEWKTPALIVGGPAAVFIFVCLFGAAFLHPGSFGDLFASLFGKPTGRRSVND